MTDLASDSVRPLSPISSSSGISGDKNTEARSLLDYMVSTNLLDRAGAERAFQARQQTSERLDTILSGLGLISAQQLSQALASFCGLELVRAGEFPLVPVLETAIPADFLKQNRILPLALDGSVLTLAVADPLNNQAVAGLLYSLDLTAKTKVATASEIEAAISRIYEPVLEETQEHASGRGDALAGVSEDDLQRLRDIASEAPVIRLVNRLIVAAADQRASDIHIEPQADILRVRFRVDGRTVEFDRLPLAMQAGVASRVKILARLNIAERRLPQDGRIKTVVAGREVDIRVSTIPVMNGESIVLRILDQSQVELSFDALGFERSISEKLGQLLSNPNGIILVTGPTGSGKTTTLYTALKQLNRIERTVFSVEDPVEYQLPGINQVQIKPSIGLDFVDCLRSILRQDPDTIMIGEMRDLETVRIGVQASLTGHLVLSTLHTNSAAASIARILDMGAEDYLIASTLLGVMAQRLVRRLCDNCAIDEKLDQTNLDALLAVLPVSSIGSIQPRPRRSVGCSKCNHSGFSGRTTIYELLTVTPKVRSLIRKGVSEADIVSAGQSEGMATLYQCGVRKVLAGETTLAEVLEVVRA
jgi:general secretion pathway protein E